MSGRHIGGIAAVVAAAGFFVYFVLGYWYAPADGDPQEQWNSLLSQLIVPLGLVVFGVWLLTIKKKAA